MRVCFFPIMQHGALPMRQGGSRNNAVCMHCDKSMCSMGERKGVTTSRTSLSGRYSSLLPPGGEVSARDWGYSPCGSTYCTYQPGISLLR